MNPQTTIAILIALLIGAITIITFGYVMFSERIHSMRRILDYARSITDDTCAPTSEAAKRMKRRFNLAYDESFGVGCRTQEKVKVRSTAKWDA